jgi:hypothetical protein
MSKLKLSIHLILLTCFSCSPKKRMFDENTKGHWHVVHESYMNSAKTLDITDSATHLDKYDLGICPKYAMMSNNPETGEQILPLDGRNEYTSNFKIYGEGDWQSLTIGANNYIRSNRDTCEIRDRYLSVKININLNKAPESIPYMELTDQSSCNDLFIGKHKRSYFENYDSNDFEKLISSYPDSIFIQAGQGLINFNQILFYCESLESVGDPTLVLHVDNSINNIFVQKVKNRVPRNFIIYQAVKNEQGGLGVVRIYPN